MTRNYSFRKNEIQTTQRALGEIIKNFFVLSMQV